MKVKSGNEGHGKQQCLAWGLPACAPCMAQWLLSCCHHRPSEGQVEQGRGGAPPGTCPGTLTPAGVPGSSCQSLDPNLGSSLTCSPALPTLLTPAPLKQSRYATITFFFFSAAAAAKSHQSCPTLCDPIDSSPPGSPVPGILQARTLEWAAISLSSAGK